MIGVCRLQRRCMHHTDSHSPVSQDKILMLTKEQPVVNSQCSSRLYILHIQLVQIITQMSVVLKFESWLILITVQLATVFHLVSTCIKTHRLLGIHWCNGMKCTLSFSFIGSYPQYNIHTHTHTHINFNTDEVSHENRRYIDMSVEIFSSDFINHYQCLCEN